MNFNLEITNSNKLLAKVGCNTSYISAPEVIFEINAGSHTTVWRGCYDTSFEIENITCMANLYANLTANLGSGCYILNEPISAKCPGKLHDYYYVLL